MSVTPARVLNAKEVETGDDQLDLFEGKTKAERPMADRGFLCPCPTPELCKTEPRTCWKR